MKQLGHTTEKTVRHSHYDYYHQDRTAIVQYLTDVAYETNPVIELMLKTSVIWLQ